MPHENINASTSGVTPLVAATAGRRVLIQAAIVSAAAAVNATFEDTDGNDLVGPIAMGENGGFVIPFNEAGWHQSPEGKGIQIRLDGAVQVGGSMTYRVSS